MISIGDSDWDDSDDELLPVVTKPLTNGHNNTSVANGSSEADIRMYTQDFYTFEDLQSATIRGNLELVIAYLSPSSQCSQRNILKRKFPKFFNPTA